MPRRPRMYLPGYPYHLVQRGNNREACFYQVADYQYYLYLLSQLLHKYGVQLDAYVLMTNHIHLLLTPEEKDSISRMMRVVGSRYAQYFNKAYQRTGTLWEGRHKSSVVDSQRYLLTCYRYIELNPVVAKMVDRPEEYRWSSYGANGWGDSASLITQHPEYLALGADALTRSANYRQLFGERMNDEDVHSIRKATHSCQPLGSDRFRQEIEARLGQPVGHMSRGRPRKVPIGLG